MLAFPALFIICNNARIIKKNERGQHDLVTQNSMNEIAKLKMSVICLKYFSFNFVHNAEIISRGALSAEWIQAASMFCMLIPITRRRNQFIVHTLSPVLILPARNEFARSARRNHGVSSKRWGCNLLIDYIHGKSLCFVNVPACIGGSMINSHYCAWQAFVESKQIYHLISETLFFIIKICALTISKTQLWENKLVIEN